MKICVDNKTCRKKCNPESRQEILSICATKIKDAVYVGPACQPTRSHKSYDFAK